MTAASRQTARTTPATRSGPCARSRGSDARSASRSLRSSATTGGRALPGACASSTRRPSPRRRSIDIVPLPYSMVTREFATGYYHWFFLIQPAPLPETLIGNSAEFYLKSRFLGAKYFARKRSPNTCARSRIRRRFMRRARTTAPAPPSISRTPTRRGPQGRGLSRLETDPNGDHLINYGH